MLPLQRHAVRVSSVGEHVLLQIGSSSWRMHYLTALALSYAMRKTAQAVKMACGDTSRYTSVTGVLHDAEKGPDFGQPFNPGGLFNVNKDLIRMDQVGARGQGSVVMTKLGSSEAGIPYADAFTISQWIRLRAKESKRRAGDARHWSGIITS